MLTPRVLGLWRAWGRWSPGADGLSRARWFGLEIASTLGELVLNLFLGPMLFYLHARFVLEILSGGQVTWRNQSRDPRQGISWSEALRAFWLPTALGGFGVFAAHKIRFPLALFLVPVLAGWLLSVPLAVWTSNPLLGERLVRRGLFPDLFTEYEVNQLGALLDRAGRSRQEARP